MNCTPQELAALAAAAGYGQISPNLIGAVISGQWSVIAADPSVLEGFDPAPCAAPLVTKVGGGDLFDCYTVAEEITSLPEAGTNFTGLWIFGEDAFGNPKGDTYETYSVGNVGVMGNGTGFSADWIVNNSDIHNPLGDTFETYPVGAAGTLSDGTGFTGDWIHS